MRIALKFGFYAIGVCVALAGTAQAQDAAPQNGPPTIVTTPSVLNPSDISLYREAFATARKGQISRAKTLMTRVSDPSLQGYVEAAALLSSRNVKVSALIDWLQQYRNLACADRVYRAAVSRSTRKIRRHHKTIIVANVTNIPAPVSVGNRSGGYEDAELPEPTPPSEAGRAVLPQILADIKAGNPDAALALMQGVKGKATADDIAALSHRIAASYRAEGMDAQAFQVAAGVTTKAVPELDWDAGFSAYRLGHYAEAIAYLEKLARNKAAQGQLRAQAAFWAARAHMQMGDPTQVVRLLAAAAKEEPSFYGLIAEHILGIDTGTGFSDAVLSQADYTALMTAPSAHRAVALYQVGEGEFVGSELNHAFVENDARLDPAMAALAHDIGVTNVELRASEKSVARGLLLSGLFPVPPYAPQDGYHVDKALVLAFERIESRFQNAATSPAGARGVMQIMPVTADHLGGAGAANQLYDPSYSLSLGQRYIARLLDRLDGNLLELGGAYNAGPQAVDRWLATKAGKDDPLLFVESIPVAETRAYVKHLMEYHWMYRRRFDQDPTSLDQIARGAWPTYRPVTPSAPPLPRPPAAQPVVEGTQISDARY